MLYVVCYRYYLHILEYGENAMLILCDHTHRSCYMLHGVIDNEVHLNLSLMCVCRFRVRYTMYTMYTLPSGNRGHDLT